LRAVESWGVPKIRALVEATYFAGLRKPVFRRNEIGAIVDNEGTARDRNRHCAREHCPVYRL